MLTPPAVIPVVVCRLVGQDHSILQLLLIRILRMNPCTLGWYLPLLVRDAPGALQPSEGKDGRTRDHATADERSTGTAWRDLDAKFRKDLPDEAYVGRLVYRGLIMQSCPNIKLLDGVPITNKEKDKAGRLLESILANRASAPRDGVAGA
jgi:protein NUD1